MDNNQKNNYVINATLKGFLIGMIFAVFLVAILLWYLSNYDFSLKKEFIHNKNKLNKISEPIILSFPDFNYTDKEYKKSNSQEEMDKIIKNIGKKENLENKKSISNNTKKDTTKNQNIKITHLVSTDNLDNMNNIAPNNKYQSYTDKANNDDILGNVINKITSDSKKVENYTLQIGYFSHQEVAKAQLIKLVLLNIPAKMQRVIKDSNEHYKIVYQDIPYNKAISTQKLLQKNNIHSFIIKN